MTGVRQTETFSAWLRSLVDSRARAKIAARIDRLMAAYDRRCADIADAA